MAKYCGILNLGQLSTAGGGWEVTFKPKEDQRVGRMSQSGALEMEMIPHPPSR